MYLHWTPSYRRWYENAMNQLQQQNASNQNNCVQLFNQLCMNRKRKIAAAAEYVLSIDQKRSYEKRRYWVSPVCKLRKKHGFYHAVLPALKLENLGYENYFRMSASQFESLFLLVGPLLVKSDAVREPIEPGERLSSTLRFLASGDSIHSMHYQYLFGTPTASDVFAGTCKAIWSVLQPKVLPKELDSQQWLRIADDYEKKWNFPNCIGSIDGKHINIQCPPNSGSSYYNYKNHHSIVLMAICDANYVFRLVDIGAYGRRSDGGIFAASKFGKKFEGGEMNLPTPRYISDTRGSPLPYCLVGDEAFPLKDYLMRPYPGKDSASLPKRVFNYRLSRARKIIENAFGILANRWRIFRTSIIGKTDNVVHYVKAGICLHNWLRLQDISNSATGLYLDEQIDQLQQSASNQTETNPGAFKDITRAGANNPTRRADKIREEFCSYFNNEGALEWQYDYI